tara:strand:- start:5924 stop:6787 length:864 start_codon:yes stop_codon:yes gene_type:complete
MNNNNILLSFLLCTINKEDDFERSINSLFKNKVDDVSFEVIVVDQGNSESVSTLCKFYGANYIATNTIGLSVARNIGLKKCKGKYIALMDDDAFIAKDYYKNLNLIIQNIEFEDFDVISGRIMTIEDNSVALSRYQDSEKKDINFNNIDVILSSALVIKSKVFNTIGNFDENFGVGAKWGGSEETDLVARIIHKNYLVKYIPSLVIYHPRTDFDSMSLKDTFYKTYSYGLGRGAFLRKNKFFPKHLIPKYLILPFLASLVSIILLRPKSSLRYISSFSGRLVGYLKF